MLSRVAESCFWMSRYIERAETSARLLDVNMQLLLDFENQDHGVVDADTKHWVPILASLEDQELFQELYGELTAESVQEFVAFEPKNPNSIYSCIGRARENARTIREQISSEMWEQLNRLYLGLRSSSARVDFRNNPSNFFQSIAIGSHLFQGITDATMTHGLGWDFLQVGKYLERADSTSRVLDIKYHILLPQGQQVGGAVDLIQWMAVLRSCSAMEAYLKSKVGQVTSWQIAEFLVLHQSFPRSIRFCVDQLDLALHRISGMNAVSYGNEVERLAGMLRSDLDYAAIDSIFQIGLHQYLDSIQARLNDISGSLLKTYCQWLEIDSSAA
ncbi:MAG: alpha-E domain-containing protein [Chthoniobacterales bacterium]